jgi:hypothetical protein
MLNDSTTWRDYATAYFTKAVSENPARLSTVTNSASTKSSVILKG